MYDSPTPSRPLKAYAAVAKWSLWLLLGAWLVLVLAWGALHGWIVPRIGEFRPRLEVEAGRVLGVPVRIGSIEARSEGLGRGAEFIVRLPLAAQAALEPAAAAPEPDAGAAAAIGPVKVLVVDDNHDAADTMEMLLRVLGAQVRVARDGPQALEAFMPFDPDLVLLDIGMPGMDGYEVARALRGRHAGHRARMVALTGWGQEADRQRGREAGFDHHLVKPADIAAIQALLAELGGAAARA